MTALVGYWVLVRWVPVPGLGVPGRDIPFMGMNHNLVSWIDQHLFPHHLYLYGARFEYARSRGPVSDLPAIGTALMGLLTGIWLRISRGVYANCIRACRSSLVTCLAAWIPMVAGVPAEQEHVDKFVCAGGGEGTRCCSWRYVTGR